MSVAIALTPYYALLSALYFSGRLPSSEPVPFPKRPFLLHEALLPQFLLILALWLPWPRKVASALFLPLIVQCYIRLLGAGSASPAAGYVIGTFIAFHAFQALDLLVLSDPRTQFRLMATPATALKERRPKSEVNGYTVANGKGTTEKDAGEPYPWTDGWRRLAWVLELTHTLRGISWSWQMRTPCDANLARPRAIWVLRRLVRVLVFWVHLDLLVYYMRTLDVVFFLPVGHSQGFLPPAGGQIYHGLFSPSTKAHKTYPPPRGLPFLTGAADTPVQSAAVQAVRNILAASAMLGAIDGLYSAVSVLFTLPALLFPPAHTGIAARWTTPAAWPPVFGSWGNGDFRSIRNFWGRGWHGLFRRVFTSPAIWLVRHSPILQGNTTVGNVAATLTAFACSATLHWAGCWTQSYGGWGAIRFFALQPLGVAFETAVLAGLWRPLTRVLRIQDFTVTKLLESLVGYAWTVAWFVVTSQSFLEEYRWGGLWTVEPVPGSFVKAATGQGAFWRWASPDENGRGWWRWADSKQEGSWAGEWAMVW